MMIYLMEVAAADAIRQFLPAGWVSVGVSVEVRHLAATPVGSRVTAVATVRTVDDATVGFVVEARDEREEIGRGTHTRAPVELERFRRRVQSKVDHPAP